MCNLVEGMQHSCSCIRLIIIMFDEQRGETLSRSSRVLYNCDPRLRHRVLYQSGIITTVSLSCV
jgi:hypothetical protein